MENNAEKLKIAVLGGGCFWCLEAVFLHVKGVEKVVSGYAGGEKENPTYAEVSGGQTGHAEAVKISFDEKVISYQEILRIFFGTHNPTTPNRQGIDEGTQYRSIILYADDEQKKTAERTIEIMAKNNHANPIVTEIVPLEKFYPAEEYHQRYFEKNPEQAYCRVVVAAKLSKYRERFQKFYR